MPARAAGTTRHEKPGGWRTVAASQAAGAAAGRCLLLPFAWRRTPAAYSWKWTMGEWMPEGSGARLR